jgi:hypothetical protein
MAKQIEARYGLGGCLLLSKKVPGVTHKLDRDGKKWYGGRHFVCESIFEPAAKAMAEAMGWKWMGTEPFSGDKT